MKRLTIFKAIILTTFALVLGLAGERAGAAASSLADEHFSVREYNLFHDVLHPLQHEALPKKDFKTIRARAAELVTLGRAILKLGVPASVLNKTEFAKGLKDFEKALLKFKADARKKSDTRLVESYNSVHDTFEMLASLLPEK